jgi:hypothetical protein
MWWQERPYSPQTTAPPSPPTIPLTLLIGDPRAYALGTVDTSGWTAGVYTITVDLLDAADNPIPDGQGYGFLGVGQALGASHAVQPLVVAPGTVTVTTVITTEVLAGAILPPGRSAVAGYRTEDSSG